MSLSSTLPTRLVVVRAYPYCSAYILTLLGISPCVSAVKAYGELPENAKINETDTFGDEEGECTFEFGDEGEVDIDDI